MVHEFTVAGAWTLLAVVSVAGFFGLRMCREILKSESPGSLRRAAALSMLEQVNTFNLNGHRRAVVSVLLSEYARHPEKSTHVAPFHGGTKLAKQSIE